MHLRLCARFALLTLVLFLAFSPGRAQAQDDGTSVSGSLADSTPISGLTTDIDPDGGLTQSDPHTDVSDPTHSQLLGSALSPGDFSYPATDVSANVSSSAMTDAESAIGATDLVGAGRVRNQTFAAGGASTAASAMEARQDSRQAFASGTLTAAFSGVSSKSAFGGLSTQLTQVGGQSFSGQGVALPPATTGVGPTQTLVQTSETATQGSSAATDPALATDPSGTQGYYYATDPVLTQQAEASLPSLQLGTQILPPTMQASQTFLQRTSETVPQYEYDDGQTPQPAASRALVPGAILPDFTVYLEAVSGFPDSTRGMAALPTEASNLLSPLSPLKDPDASPFPAVSDGNVFGVKAGLHPTLHISGGAPLRISFRDYEAKAQEARLLHGMSITQAQQFYQADLRQYQQGGGRGERKSTLQPDTDQNPAPVIQTTYHGVIR